MNDNLLARNEWQYLDENNGLVMPWYTRSFLNELTFWELKDKTVFEYGAGSGTLWWNKKAKKVVTVENNSRFYDCLVRGIGINSVILYEVEKEEYITSITNQKTTFDIIIVDGDPVEWRDECIKTAIKSLKDSGILIVDNYDQKSVYVPSDEIRELLSSYNCKTYKQDGHPDWQTCTFTKS